MGTPQHPFVPLDLMFQKDNSLFFETSKYTDPTSFAVCDSTILSLHELTELIK